MKKNKPQYQLDELQMPRKRSAAESGPTFKGKIVQRRNAMKKKAKKKKK